MVITTVHTRAVIREDPGDKLVDDGGINFLLRDESKIGKGTISIKI